MSPALLSTYFLTPFICFQLVFCAANIFIQHHCALYSFLLFVLQIRKILFINIVEGITYFVVSSIVDCFEIQMEFRMTDMAIDIVLRN